MRKIGWAFVTVPALLCLVLTQDAFGFWHRRCRPAVCVPQCPPCPLYPPGGLVGPGEPGTPTPPVTPPGAPKKVKIVIIADTTDTKLADSIKLGLDRLQAILALQIAPAYRDEKPILITPDDLPDPVNGFPDGTYILDKIKALGDLKDQALVCYYLGHAAIDPSRTEPYLDLSGARPIPAARRQVLKRADLLAKMKDTGALLRVLLTDSCATFVPAPAQNPGTRGPVTAGGGTGISTKKLDTLKNLFLGYTGEVDINAASPGQSAYYHEIFEGGLFSWVFTELVQTETIETWDAAEELLRRKTEEKYRTDLLVPADAFGSGVARGIKDQKTQKPDCKLSVKPVGQAPSGTSAEPAPEPRAVAVGPELAPAPRAVARELAPEPRAVAELAPAPRAVAQVAPAPRPVTQIAPAPRAVVPVALAPMPRATGPTAGDGREAAVVALVAWFAQPGAR